MGGSEISKRCQVGAIYHVQKDCKFASETKIFGGEKKKKKPTTTTSKINVNKSWVLSTLLSTIKLHMGICNYKLQHSSGHYSFNT